MIVGALALAAAAHLRLRARSAPRRARRRRRRRRRRASRLAVWLAAVAVAVVAAAWMVPTLGSLAGGMDRADTPLVPHAARDPVRRRRRTSGSIDYFDPIFFASYYPANSEVFHAVRAPRLRPRHPLAAAQPRLARARPDRRLLRSAAPTASGRRALIGGAIALGAQNLVEFQAGEALNDIVGVALHPRRGRDPRQRRAARAASASAGRVALRTRWRLPALARRRASPRASRRGRSSRSWPRSLPCSSGLVVIAGAGRAPAHRALVRRPRLPRRRLLVRAQPGRGRQPDPVHDASGRSACRRPSAASSCGPGSRSSTTRPTPTSGRTGSSRASTTRSGSSGRWCSRPSSAAAPTRSGAAASRCCGCSAPSSCSPRSPTCSRR